MDMDWLRGKCIGKGAFGTVHLAVDRATGRSFAVKSVDAKAAPSAALACIETEISILRRLSSPYVVAYLGEGATASTRDLHMELLSGGTAAEAAAARGGLGERAARGVLRRVAAALRYLHNDAGVVHGDVKGRNVLLGCDADDCCSGGAKLADFGAARMLVSDDVSRGPRGTPAWMAPEVARGGAAMPASDVWSLGCTALELLTGKRPLSELGGAVAEVGELLFLIGFGGTRPAIPANLSDACRDFIDKCLRRDAGQRWTCDQLLRHPFLSSDAAQDGEPSPYPSPRAVLDWAALSDSDSEALVDDELDEPEAEEAMARAKGRVAELAASNGPRAGWGTIATWAADTWVPLPISEAPSAVVPMAPSTSNSDAGNGNAGWPATSIARSSAAAAGRGHQVVGVGSSSGTGGGLLFVHDRPGCQCHCCHYKYGFGVGWLPLAVVPWPMPSCCCSFLVDSIQSNFVTNRMSTGFRTLFFLR